MLEETGCAGVSIGRGAFYDPWIFKRTLEYLSAGRSRREKALTNSGAKMQDLLTSAATLKPMTSFPPNLALPNASASCAGIGFDGGSVWRGIGGALWWRGVRGRADGGDAGSGERVRRNGFAITWRADEVVGVGVSSGLHVTASLGVAFARAGRLRCVNGLLDRRRSLSLSGEGIRSQSRGATGRPDRRSESVTPHSYGAV